jgi:hypothetical protein
MNFKRYTYPLLIPSVLLISCSMDPVNVDTNKPPAETKTFRKYGMQYMVPGYNGDYIANDGYRIFCIAPDSADESGNIVHYLFQVFPDTRGLFYDSLKRICLITNTGIFTIDSACQPTLQTEFAQDLQWMGLPVVSVDWNGGYRYLRWDAYNHYWIFRYSSGEERLSTDAYTDINHPILLFASADNRYTVVYGGMYAGTWLRLYVNDTLERTIHLFDESDTVRIENIFYVGDKLQLLCDLWNDVIVEIDDRTSLNLDRGDHLLTFGPNGDISARKDSFIWTIPRAGANIYYRSSKETWLWDSLSYCIITPDSIEHHDFREDYINKFNVLSFRDSSEVLFYDEVTQRFISRQ